MSLIRFAGVANAGAAEVVRWEEERDWPRLPSLRRIRDGIDLGPTWLDGFLTKYFPSTTDAPYSESSRAYDDAWGFLRSPFGSEEERHFENELLVTHRPLAVRASRKFWLRNQLDDLQQVSLMALAQAIGGYIPTVGPFSPFASAYCVGHLRGFLSNVYYEELPPLIRKRYTLVLRACKAFSATNGRLPTERELVAELPVPQGEIREALLFHRNHRTDSLDAERGETDLTPYEKTALPAPPRKNRGAGTRRLAEALAGDPSLAEELGRKVTDRAWLEATAAQAKLTTDEVREILTDHLPAQGDPEPDPA